MDKRLIFLSALLLLGPIGCGSRYVPSDNNPLKPVVNLYSRNAIVAAPTLGANYLCGIVVAPISFGLAAISHRAGEISWDYGVVSAASICGAIVGTPFIPLSYLCPEDPWYIGKIEKTPWPCDSEVTVTNENRDRR
jgi:hypothetical protein